ncbi:MAG: flagellar hook-length control protein FliK [Muribaculaceae bacterium]|nr:flagellar hook-length control protein FliK [Roseburia sp.]MCM1430926.1 flagellar hook-length control protein FliK [Muribaculaceae bacterium]MCM1491713.1 flagellar hook-length control protein FliK [Muribaculaceae bacterium]
MGEFVYIETNLWENVDRNVDKKSMGKGIAAYQSYMPESSNAFAVQKEKYEKLAGVSAAGNVNMADATYQNPMNAEQDKTVAEEIQSNEGQSAESRANEMAVIANTTSPEDLKQMEEQGFSASATDSHTIITVTDKIKAVLAEAGVDISVYGDTLTREQLEQITGNPAVVNQIMQTLTANDLPLTEANVQESVAALEQAATLTGVSEDAMGYLLKNELEPTIHNVYTAEHAGTVTQENSVELVTPEDLAALETQIAAIIEEAGLTADAETVENGKWLVSHQLPVTKENLVYIGQLKELSTQLSTDTYDWNALTDSMAKAITSGRRPEDGYMITARRKLEETRLIMTTEASRAMAKHGINIDTKPLELLVENLKQQERQFYRGLLTGAGIEATEKNIDIFARTEETFADMKSAPAYTLGQVSDRDTVEIIHGVGESLRGEFAERGESYEPMQAAQGAAGGESGQNVSDGTRAQGSIDGESAQAVSGREFEQANDRYETMQTAPRKDMGDSIQKAFRNVDDILSDMNLETSEANRRAVRILSYNETEITEENIQAVKARDEEMQRAFKNMTPAVTLELIRRGENPLDMTMEELNHTVEQIKAETGNEEQERFSKFLWKLEQNQEISREERESYIGIYRLIAQVEKTDGAALGFLMNQGSEPTMRNLLTAMRSARKSGGIDYTVDDDFEGVESTAGGPRIDEQIQAAFQQNCLKDVLDNVSPEKLAQLGTERWENMTPEQLAAALQEMETSEQETQAQEAYIKEQLAAYQQVLETSEEVYSYLERYDMPNSVINIMAATELLRHPNSVMQKLWKKEGFSKDSMELIADLKAKVLKDFGESLKNPEELADAQETLADVAEHVMDTMLVEDPSVRSLDIREMRQMTSAFALCAKKAKEESYMVPVQTGDSVTGVSLKIVRGTEKKGMVDILFDSPRLGKVAASFHAKEQGISGMIAVEDQKNREMLARNLGSLVSALKGSGAETGKVDIRVTLAKNLSLEHYEMAGIQREEKMAAAGELAEERTDTVQTTRLYHIAESFIQYSSKFM